jgi:peroxiredoxin
MMANPIRTGDTAPDFTLPAVNKPGSVSLRDFRNKSAVLLGLYRGLHCPFCRRQIVQLSAVQKALSDLGVTTVAVVNTRPERAEVYFRYHPTPVTLLADPDARTHRAFGVPCGVLDETFAAARIDPTSELPAPLPPLDANAALNAKDGFTPTTVDDEIFAAHGTQLAGHFLIDRDGTVRWTSIEAERGVTDLGRFPTAGDLLAASRALGQ